MFGVVSEYKVIESKSFVLMFFSMICESAPESARHVFLFQMKAMKIV